MKLLPLCRSRTRRLRVIVAFLLVVPCARILSACAVEYYEHIYAYRIHGNVYNAYDKNPVAGARIEIWATARTYEQTNSSPFKPDGKLAYSSASTDKGTFSVSTLVPGNYVLVISSEEYGYQSAYLTILRHEPKKEGTVIARLSRHDGPCGALYQKKAL